MEKTNLDDIVQLLVVFLFDMGKQQIICDVIKQNESELADMILRYSQ